MKIQQVISEGQRTRKRINKITAFLQEMSDGRIEKISRNNKDYYRVCLGKGKERSYKYIAPEDEETVLKYAQKNYRTELLGILERNEKAISEFVKRYNSNPEDTALSSLPDWQADMIRNDASSYNGKYISDWLKEPYVQNPFRPEERTIKTLRGDYVRSKSERDIADALYRRGIPYRIDCEVKLKDGTIYTDFVILHPHTLELYYWEHSGMLGDQSYIQANYDRISRYALSGILIGERLIVTGECNKQALESETIERLIEAFFG